MSEHGHGHVEKVESEEPAERWPIVIKLNKPVNVMGSVKNEISFREPRGGDLRTVLSSAGAVIEFEPYADPPKLNPNTAGMMAMIGRLSDWPASSVDLMSPQDISVCAWRLSGFFMPMAARSGTA